MPTFRVLPIFALFLIYFATAPAQSNVGTLYGINHLSSEAGLFAIDYPSETFSRLDSAPYQDLCLIDSFLYLSSRGTNISSHYLYQFHTFTRQKTDSFALSSSRLCSWQDKLLVICDEHPYVRVFDPQQAWSLVLEFDSSKVPFKPQEVITDGDKAYLLFGQSYTSLSFSQADTLANVPTPPPFFNQSFNTSISQDKDNLYIGVDYATGAIRSSMIRVDKSNDSVSTAFHREFQGFFSPPVPYTDRVFVYIYSDYYDVAQDSLYEFVHVLTETVLAADTSSEQIFIWDVLNRRLSVEAQSQRSNGIGLLLQPDKVIWQSADNSVAIDKSQLWDFEVYPNPTQGSLVLSFPNREKKLHLSLVDLSGRLLAEREVRDSESVIWELPAGLPPQFLLYIKAEDGRFMSKTILRSKP